MRYKVLTTALFLAFNFVAFGQTRSNFEEEVAIGATGGMNLSQVRFLHNNIMSENELGDMGWKKGATFGLAGRFIAQKHFGLQLEVNYLQGGWSEKFDEEATANNISFAGATTNGELNYLSIPLLAHIYFGNKSRFFVNVGPKMGFLLNSKAENTFTDEQLNVINTNNPRDPRINDNTKAKKNDYGICIGGGYELHLNKLSILTELRWSYGLQDVYSHEKKDVYQRSNNQNVSISIGILMPVVKFHSN